MKPLYVNEYKRWKKNLKTGSTTFHNRSIYLRDWKVPFGKAKKKDRPEQYWEDYYADKRAKKTLKKRGDRASKQDVEKEAMRLIRAQRNYELGRAAGFGDDYDETFAKVKSKNPTASDKFVYGEANKLYREKVKREKGEDLWYERDKARVSRQYGGGYGVRHKKGQKGRIGISNIVSPLTLTLSRLMQFRALLRSPC